VELLRKRRLPTYDAEARGADMPPLIRVVASHLGDCQTIISVPDAAEEPMEMTFGPLSQPLGLQRQCVLELIEALTLTNNSVVFDALLAAPVLQTAIALFFQYAWNNFLHQTIFNIVATIIPSTHAALKNHLLTTCRLLDLILDAEAANKIEFDEKNISRGYIGHLTKISALINAAAEGTDAEHPGDPAIKALLDARPSWKEYSDTVLAERVKLESQLLGGVRPTAPPAMDDEQGQDASGQLASMMYRIGGVGSMFEPQQQEDEAPDDGDIGEGAFDPSEFDSRAPFPTEERQFAFDTAANFDNDDDDEEDSSSSGSDEANAVPEAPEDEGDVLIHTGAVEVVTTGGALSEGSSSPMSPLVQPASSVEQSAEPSQQQQQQPPAQEQPTPKTETITEGIAQASLDDSAEKDDAPLPSPPAQEAKTDTEPLPDVPMTQQPPSTPAADPAPESASAPAPEAEAAKPAEPSAQEAKPADPAAAPTTPEQPQQQL